jgi:signal transduction histidine kinase/ActR/RegA family two-component response regulator
MPKFKDISIKGKLTLRTMIASTVALLLVSGGIVACELITGRQAMTRDLSTLAAIIGDRSAAALSFNDKADAKETLAALNAKKHVLAAALYDTNGRLFTQFERGGGQNLFPAWPEKPGARIERDHFVLFHEIRLDGEVVGTLYLKSDLDEMHQRSERYAMIVAGFLLACLTVAFVLSLVLHRPTTRSISHLAKVARVVSEKKNYSLRASHNGNDELGQVVDGLNDLLGQIQERDAALQESNEELERRVWSRTQDLRTEISNRQRAESALQQQLMRMSLLHQMTQAISERQETESFLLVALRQLEDHLSLDLSCIALVDAQVDTPKVAALRVKDPLLTSKLDLHEGGMIAVADTGLQPCKEGQTVYTPDTLKGTTALIEKLAGAGLRSVVAVPLLLQNRLFGVLIAARMKTDGFTSGDCEFLRMLSEHLARAAFHARLHTELRQAYDELRQTQQTVVQQERLKALGHMASGIAHDINNALSPVVGFADLMLRGEHGLTDSGKKYLGHIRTAGEDISRIVARLREFYRRRDDRESLQELDLNALVRHVIDMTRPSWRDVPQSRGITVEVQSDLGPQVPELVGIENEICEALTNLVLNAVDALPNGGRIILRTRVSRPEDVSGGSDAPAHVTVEVSDTGIGMNEETRKRCLEPFFSTKGKRGAGLGLAMVYGVMERHEGKIEIQSETGKGATFRLVFPVRKMADVAAELQQEEKRAESLQILCIDDEPLLRDLLKEMLERDGHRVEVSDSGQSGLDAFRQAQQHANPFDIVITDLGMPHVDGRQVARVIKGESPATPIIMLTGWGSFMKGDGEAPTHVDGVLSKPPRSRELRETLNRLTQCRNRTPAHQTLVAA